MTSKTSVGGLLAYYDLFPFERHPLWMAIKRHELSLTEVLLAETQHYLRTREGQPLRLEALQQIQKVNERIYESLLETWLEECTDQRGPNHLALIERLLLDGGVTREQLAAARPSVGNAVAIATYREISRRGSGCHMLGAGAVEHFYSRLCPDIFEAYTTGYGMTPRQAETYAIHGPMDAEHANRAFEVLPDAVSQHGWQAVDQSVRDAFAATSIHYDGMLEAATGEVKFWNGGR